MSTEAIVMMVVAMLLLWGGLVVAIISLNRRADPSDEPAEPDRLPRDL